ncbi:MAG: 23S rRNA (pseudouridine(1915)-N(3))-methyltransferase RlmH [Cyanobacteria bacterium]|nr:23S rRNA (pseudouridine(1915)-N(3))-methyltransferase RlmH [Cyanobacteriota bacterium]MDW8200003.1 23S rRNA (pseudouridine(1915)-N(3))-methyltransferase RlmH [Cyanobacteriota bacterium SKYGB_h_bin112]
MKLYVIAVGKIKKAWIQTGIQELSKRLPELVMLEVKDSNPEKEAADIDLRLRSSIPQHYQLLVLSEEGALMTSVEFAALLREHQSQPLVFAVGGPDGVANSLKQQALKLVSLSPMTFPHELARLLLIEQLYRAKTILQNGSYHR